MGGIKSPCGIGDTQIPTYVGIGAISVCVPSPNSILAAEKALGRVFGGIKSPCGNGDTHPLGFPHKIGVFSYGKNPGACFLGAQKAPAGMGTRTPWFWASTGLEPRPRTRVLRGAPSVCQPTGQSDDGGPSACQTTGQSDDGGPSGQGIPRSDPSFLDTKSIFSDLI